MKSSLLFLLFITLTSSQAAEADKTFVNLNKKVNQILFPKKNETNRKVSQQDEGRFQCETLVLNDCSMQLCEGFIPSYKEKVSVYIPKDFNRLNVHFHGHILGKLPQYESSIHSMVLNFGLVNNMCQGKSINIFPKSTGNCATYDEYYVGAQAFQQFIEQVAHHADLPLEIAKYPITLSAHSGGGRALVRTITDVTKKENGNAAERVDRIIFYDGLYNTWQPDVITKWYTSNSGVNLQMVSLSNNTPHALSNKILLSIPGSSIGVKLTTPMINNKKFQNRQYSTSTKTVNHYHREAISENALHDHYTVLSDTWNITH